MTVLKSIIHKRQEIDQSRAPRRNSTIDTNADLDKQVRFKGLPEQPPSKDNQDYQKDHSNSPTAVASLPQDRELDDTSAETRPVKRRRKSPPPSDYNSTLDALQARRSDIKRKINKFAKAELELLNKAKKYREIRAALMNKHCQLTKDYTLLKRAADPNYEASHDKLPPLFGGTSKVIDLSE